MSDSGFCPDDQPYRCVSCGGPWSENDGVYFCQACQPHRRDIDALRRVPQPQLDEMRIVHSSEIADDPGGLAGAYVPLEDVQAGRRVPSPQPEPPRCTCSDNFANPEPVDCPVHAERVPSSRQPHVAELVRRTWETPALKIVEAIHRDYAPDLDDNDGGQILVWILDLVERVAGSASPAPQKPLKNSPQNFNEGATVKAPEDALSMVRQALAWRDKWQDKYDQAEAEVTRLRAQLAACKQERNHAKALAGQHAATIAEEGQRIADLERQLAACERLPWQPIETAPRDEQVFFWVVTRTAEESYCDSSGKPIVSKHEPYLHQGKLKSWGATSKATHWMPIPKDPLHPALPCVQIDAVRDELEATENQLAEVRTQLAACQQDRDEREAHRVNLVRRLEMASAQLAACERLLTRLYSWDMMDGTADGPYWRSEIDAVLHPALPDPQEKKA